LNYSKDAETGALTSETNLTGYRKKIPWDLRTNGTGKISGLVPAEPLLAQRKT
jgi:hypothetical protein